MKRDKIKKILLLTIIFCFIILVLLIRSVHHEEKFHTTELKEYTRTDRYLKLNGFGVFFEQYKGYLKTSDISKKIELIITKKLPTVYETVKDYDNNKLVEYYNENASSLKTSFGILNSDQFIKFIEKIKQTGIDINTWNEVDVLKETFNLNSDRANYSYVEFEVIYDNEQKIKFSLYVEKEDFNTEDARYIIDVLE